MAPKHGTERETGVGATGTRSGRETEESGDRRSGSRPEHALALPGGRPAAATAIAVNAARSGGL